MNGKIKSLKDKGFGFIEPEGGGNDIFFHASDVTNAQFSDLQVGQAVSYDKGSGKEGKPRAADVRVE